MNVLQRITVVYFVKPGYVPANTNSGSAGLRMAEYMSEKRRTSLQLRLDQLWTWISMLALLQLLPSPPMTPFLKSKFIYTTLHETIFLLYLYYLNYNLCIYHHYMFTSQPLQCTHSNLYCLLTNSKEFHNLYGYNEFKSKSQCALYCICDIYMSLSPENNGIT